MARGRCRMIYDSIFSSPDLIDLPATARWLWLGMIVYADDNGMLRAHSGFLYHTIMTGTRTSQTRIRQFLSTFETRSMITPCTFEGISYYKITNFFRYQRLREGKGREENRREGKVCSPQTTPPPLLHTNPDPPEEDRRWDLVAQLQTVAGQVVQWKGADWTIQSVGISNGSGAILYHNLALEDLEILLDVTSLTHGTGGTPPNERTVPKNANQVPSSERSNP